MSSTQYIKIFNDTVLKQSILQGYETQRTNSELGKFTMGELAFTRDTGRVFVGTYTDNKKSSDIAYKQGGLLVGNKYYGSSSDGITPENYTHYPSYNSKYGVYNGDYTFDTTTTSLILFDNTITKSNNVTDEIYNDGFIRMRILEPDGDTITYDSNQTTHNVLKADFTTERFFKLLSNDTFISSDKEDENNGKITLKNVKLNSGAILEAPSNITIRCTTKDENNVQKSISFSEITNDKKFPTYILCAEAKSQDDESQSQDEEKRPKDYQIQFKPFNEVIDITGEGNIEVTKIGEVSDSNKQKFIIKYVKKPAADNIPDTDPDKYSETLYSDLWGFGNLGNYSGITQFTDTGTAISSHLLNYTKYTNEGDLIIDEDTITELYGKNNADNPDTTNVNENDETVNATDIIEGLKKVKNKYIGGLYNIGLNYLLTPQSLTSGEKLIHEFSYDGIQHIPFHAQSIIIRITGNGSKAEFKYNNLTILNQTIAEKDITTVEVPLIPYAFYYEDETDKTVENLNESKKFNISFSNCTAELLGYRV